MAPEQKVQVFSLGEPKKGTPTVKRRYRVKWRVDGRHKTRSFKTKDQAERLRSQLQRAVRDGLRFDPDTGLPVRWEQSTATWWSWSSEWLALKWPQWAGNSRRSAAETLVAITPHLVRRGAPAAPDGLGQWLSHVGFVPTVLAAERRGAELRWLEQWSLPLHEITPGVLEVALVAATTRQDGRRAAAVVCKRRFNGVKGVLRAAVNRELIESNPIDRVVWSAPRDSTVVNIATLPSVSDVAAVVEGLVDDDSYRHYAVFFAVIGFAGLRPSEVARLRVFDLDLPESGWGEAHVPGAVTSPGPRYTSDGQAMEEKGLKQRAEDETRSVPLPPVLVGRLRWHLDQFAKSGSDRVFTNARGGDLSKDNWGRPWRLQRARLWPAGHKLAETTTYDLRHTAATMMLRAGVSPSEVALRLGHSVDMLMKIYAGVFEDERTRSNMLIESEMEALGEGLSRCGSVAAGSTKGFR